MNVRVFQRWLVLLGITCLFVTTGISQDQQSADPTLFINVWTPRTSDSSADLTTEIFAEMVFALAGSTINHVFVEKYPSGYGNHTMSVSFYESQGIGGLSIAIGVRAPLFSQISPLLHADFDESVLFNVSENDRAYIATLVNMAVALGHYAVGDCESASPLLNAVLESAPLLAADVNFYHGNCALLAGDLESAAGFFEASLSFIEDQFSEGEISYYENTILNLAWTYVQLEQDDKAIALMDDFVEVSRCEGEPIDNLRHDYTDPPACESEALSNRAQIHALLFDFDAAVADIDAAIVLEPDNPALHVQRGQVVMLLYEWDRVLENYNTALVLDPDYASAYYHRGILYYSVLAREEALADFETYLEMAPDGEFVLQAQRYAQAIRLELEALNTP